MDRDSNRPPPLESGSLPYQSDGKYQHVIRIPGYEIANELGKGGMGIVYRARHQKLNRDVAIKVVLGEAARDPILLKRFEIEARAMASIKHHNVVEIHDFGEANGLFYIVMELLASDHFAAYMARRMPGMDELVDLMVQVCRGVGAIHSVPIVHRDIKPSNILFTANGTPKVADFGLAKLGNSELTSTMAIFGTVAYMAPEQARGQTKTCGPQADVWALGVILYEYLCGRKPFRADDQIGMLLEIVNTDPASPTSIRSEIPQALETIVLKCLAKKPEDRFRSASALADQLVQFQVDHRDLQRRRSEVQSTVIPLVTASAAKSTLPVKRDSGRRKPAKFWKGLLLLAIAIGGYAYWTSGRRPANPDVGAVSPPAAKENSWKQLIAFKTSNAGREFGLDINRDGSRIITSGTPPKIWNAKNGDIIASLNGHQFPVVSAAFSPDGKGVVTASMDKTAKVWIVESATEQFTIRGHAEAVLDAVYSPDGTSVLTASADGTARVWDAKTGNASGMVLTHPKGVLKARYSRDGSKIATVAGDNLARVWNAKTGIATHTVSGFDDPDGHIRSAMFHPDGTKILLAAHRVAIVWDLDKGAESYRFEGHEESVTNALYDSEGIEVLTSSLDGSVVVWDANSKKYTVPKYSFEREKVLVSQVATSDCYSLISTSKLRHLIFEPTNAIYSSNGKYIASVGSGTGGSTVTIWERLSGAGK